jgi:DNA-binding SARP family transcriptional activator
VGQRQHPERQARGVHTRERRQLRISLLDGFRLESDGSAIFLSERSQRLLGFLALKGRSIRRPVVAGTLWPTATEVHASSSLRSALTHLHGVARAAVEVTAQEIELSDAVTVDLWRARDLAHRLLSDGSPPFAERDEVELPALSKELLPDWYDDWVLAEAEDWRQLRLHALEALAERLIARRKYGDAAAAALAAVRAEPLRESPRAALIRVHIAEGNPSEALREYGRYRELLDLELGLQPTDRLRALVTELGALTPRSGRPLPYPSAVLLQARSERSGTSRRRDRSVGSRRGGGSRRR